MDEELIKQCRYYKGEEANPFINKQGDAVYFWQAEKTYVAHGGKADERGDGLYNALGGKDYPGVPHTLLINLFNYWSTGTASVQDEFHFFKRFMENYLNEGRQ